MRRRDRPWGGQSAFAKDGVDIVGAEESTSIGAAARASDIARLCAKMTDN
jgi:hypothetical protein